MHGFPIAGDQLTDYDISPDGRQIVVAVRDREGKPHLWLAPLDRRAPPRQIPEKLKENLPSIEDLEAELSEKPNPEKHDE